MIVLKIQSIRRGAFISAVCLLIALFLTVPTIRGSLVNVAYAFSGKTIHYYNDDVNRDNIGNNNFNFGPDRKVQADAAVANGTAQSVQEWTATNQGTGDFFSSIEVDPALCAAVALHMDESLVLPETILRDEQNELIGQRADAAHKHFLADQEYWDRAIRLIKEYLTSSEISIQPLDHYTSQMYMWNNHLDGNKPSVIVRDTQNDGGHVVVFDMGKPGLVKFRLECGYQPVDVPYWTPPGPEPTPPPEPTPTPTPTPEPTPTPTPPGPEPTPTPTPEPTPTPTPEPTPTPTPTPTPEPTPTPTPEPTPTPTPEPTPTPTPEPKDPEGGPQGQTDDDDEGTEDFGGGENHDSDDELTEEPTSPETYEPPAPPAPEPTTPPAADEPQPTTPTTSDGEPDGSSGTDSGSRTVDEDDGTVEEHVVQDPDTGQPTTQEYEVVAGDGEDHGDLNEVQEQEHGPETVEPAVQDDGVNEGDLDPDDVE